jgi:hypothetical protein
MATNRWPVEINENGKKNMLVEILVFYRHYCPVPISASTRGLLELALRRSSAILEHFGLQGSVGDLDLISENDMLAPINAAVQMFRRLDVPEMELFVSIGTAVLRLPIVWTASMHEAGERKYLLNMLQTMVADLPVCEMVIVPYPLDPAINSAYESVLNGKGFVEAAKHLSKSERGDWITRKPDGTWSECTPLRGHPLGRVVK